MIDITWPWAFALLPLPLLMRFLLPATATTQDAALYVPFLDHFQAGQTHGKWEQQSRFWLIILAALTWICLVVASSRPQWLGDPIDIPTSGRDLMLAVDLSGSMQMEDFEINGRQVNRLYATKYVVDDFILQRKGDRLGLILFGEQAYLQTPLTFDLITVQTLLREAVIGIAGDATAIGDAIGLAIKRLKDKDKDSRVLILLTDGQNTAGEVEPLKAAQLAAEQELKIYTIGIGADEILQRSFFGTRRINPSAELDEKTLTAIAEITGGRYFRARDTQELQHIYQLLDELEPTEQEQHSFRPVHALYHWPLGLGFVLMLITAVFYLNGRRA